MNLKTSELLSKFIPSVSGVTKSLLILAHGRLGNLRLLEWLAKRFQIPELSYLCIQAPFFDKPTEEDERPEKFGININDATYSWYLQNNKGLNESREKIQKSIQDLNDQGISFENIYWLGFSQGGVIGLDLFLRTEHKLGGLISVSGFCIEADSYPEKLGSQAKNQNLLITHGTRDQNIPLEDAEKTYHKLTEAGVPLELSVYDKPHSFQLNTEVPFLEHKLKSWMSPP